MKVWLAGTGKSLAVGVGTRGDGGEIDLDLLEEGILGRCKCKYVGGSRVCRDDRGDAGLKRVSNERVSQDMGVSRLQRTSIWAEGRR